MKNNYNLLNGLFTEKKSSISSIEEKKEQPTTKRTFKILNAPWDDFLILAIIKCKTQAELINSMIEQAVVENAQEIQKYKEFIKKP